MAYRLGIERLERRIRHDSASSPRATPSAIANPWPRSGSVTTMPTWLGFVWTSPNTLIGLVLGLCTFQRPRIADGAIIFDRAPRGLTALMLRANRVAMTVGFVILSARPVTGHLLAHEQHHIRQYEGGGRCSSRCTSCWRSATATAAIRWRSGPSGPRARSRRAGPRTRAWTTAGRGRHGASGRSRGGWWRRGGRRPRSPARPSPASPATGRTSACRRTRPR